MLLNTFLAKAFQFGKKKHSGQKRKFNGLPYFTHPEEVAELLVSFDVDDEVLAAALLHDTLEDTNTSYEEISTEFGTRVANLVKELTNDSEKIKAWGKAKYLAWKMNHMSTDALLIKLADRLSNLKDLNSASIEFSNRYLLQTQEILRELHPINISPHQEILSRIQQIIHSQDNSQ